MPAIFPYIVIRRAGLPFSALEGFRYDGTTLEQDLLASEQWTNQTFSKTLDILEQELARLPESPERTRVYNAKKIFFQKQKCSDVPENEQVTAAFLQYREARHQQQQLADLLEKQYQQSQTAAYRHLQELAGNPLLQRALLFSSLDLLHQIPSFISADPAAFSKKERHTASGLLKYITRMAVNTTPLSQFASIGVHQTGDPVPAGTDGEFGEAATNRRFETAFFSTISDRVKITPNVALLDAMYSVLFQEPVFYRSLRVLLNPMILGTETGTYTWWHFNGSAEAIQELPVRGAAQYLVEQLITTQRTAPFAGLTQILMDATDAAHPDAETYLLELVDIGLLSWVLPEYGNTPSWCGRMYQYLGFLEGGSSFPVINDSAFLLQWLRTAARTLPFQPVETARETLLDTATQVRVYFEKHAGKVPSIPPEQLYYEDVLDDQVDKNNTRESVDFAQQFYQIWQQLPPQPFPAFYHKIKSAVQDGPLHLAQLNRAMVTRTTTTPHLPLPVFQENTPAGFFFQTFTDENGRKNAVLNAVFPGGGRMLGRWLHLMPEEVTRSLKNWLQQFPGLYALAWHQRYNANIHPVLLDKNLVLPDGFGTSILAGDLIVQENPDGRLALIARETGQSITVIDTGLEDIATKPLLIQTILAAGAPVVNTTFFHKNEWVTLAPGITWSPRVSSGNIILQRAKWKITPDFFADLLPEKGLVFWTTIRKMLLPLGIPHQFFIAQTDQQPQWANLNSPLHVLLLEKVITNATAPLILEEFLPVSDEFAEETGVELG